MHRYKLSKERFREKLNEQFSAQDVVATRAKMNLSKEMSDDSVRRVAYCQWREQEIDKFGSYDKWRESLVKDTTAALKERFGDNFDDLTQVRMDFANALAEAEGASTNDTLDAERKQYLVNALSKADKAIRAKRADGKATYMDLVLEEWREKKAVAA